MGRTVLFVTTRASFAKIQRPPPEPSINRQVVQNNSTADFTVQQITNYTVKCVKCNKKLSMALVSRLRCYFQWGNGLYNTTYDNDNLCNNITS